MIIKTRNSQAGFTMVELIVSMSILTILSSIVFYRSRSGERNMALRRSAQVVLQSINGAANNTLSGKGHGGTVSRGGYGVHFEVGENFVTLYADCNEDRTLNETGDDTITCVESPDLASNYPEEFHVNQLEPSIRISDLQGDGSVNPLDIIFTPPNAIAVMNPPLITEEEVMIEIENIQEGNVIQIYINKAGATRMVIP